MTFVPKHYEIVYIYMFIIKQISELVNDAILTSQQIPEELLYCYINCYCQYNSCNEILNILYETVSHINKEENITTKKRKINTKDYTHINKNLDIFLYIITNDPANTRQILIQFISDHYNELVEDFIHCIDQFDINNNGIYIYIYIIYRNM